MLLEDMFGKTRPTELPPKANPKDVLFGLEMFFKTKSGLGSYSANALLVSDDGWLLSNAHSFFPDSDSEIFVPNESFAYDKYNKYELNKFIFHHSLDLALVQIKNLKVNPFRIEFSSVEKTEPITIYSIMNNNMLIKKGRVVESQLKNVNKKFLTEYKHVVTNIPLSSGQSGSPFYNSNNDIVGLATADAINPITNKRLVPYTSFGPNSYQIVDFLRKVSRHLSK